MISSGVFIRSSLVAPFAGAWIEIPFFLSISSALEVAPFAGAWIEMTNYTYVQKNEAVAPFAGAWIEI